MVDTITHWILPDAAFRLFPHWVIVAWLCWDVFWFGLAFVFGVLTAVNISHLVRDRRILRSLEE